MLAKAARDRALDVERGRAAQHDRLGLAEVHAQLVQEPLGRGLAGRDHDPVAVALDRDPALVQELLGVEAADERLVDGGAQQVDELEAPLLSEHAVQVQSVHALGGLQDAPDPLAGARLAGERPAQRAAVDQPGLQQRLPDREWPSRQLRSRLHPAGSTGPYHVPDGIRRTLDGRSSPIRGGAAHPAIATARHSRDRRREPMKMIDRARRFAGPARE